MSPSTSPRTTARLIPLTPRARRTCGVAAVVLSAGLLTGTTVAPSVASAPERGTVLPVDLETAGMAELQRALTNGQVTAVQLTEAYLARIDALNTAGPGLNAVRAIAPDALAQAAALDLERQAGKVRGPLHGLPVLLKDNIDVEDMPTTAGSVALANSFPAGDAAVTQRLEEAGAVILGKTNLTEFANYLADGMPGGYSSLGGQVLNPYDTSTSPSGSSAGSGSATAAALAAGTVGTETSGSILSPARASSNVGIKPTVGLVSRTGIVPISASQDTAGPMTRYVYDAAAMLSGMTGVDPLDPATAPSAPYVTTDYTRALSTTALDGAQIGYIAPEPPEEGEEPSEAEAVYLTSLEALRAEGATLVEVTVGNTDAPGILAYEFERDLDAYLDTLPAGEPIDSMDEVIAYNEANPGVALKFGQERMLAADKLDLADPAVAAEYEAALAQGLAETRAAIDGALLRTDEDPANDLDAVVSASQTTGVGARAGYPSVIVPAGYTPDSRTPVGIVFLGTAFSEATLLGLAYDYEQASLAWQPPSAVNPAAFRCTAVDDDTAFDGSCAP